MTRIIAGSAKGLVLRVPASGTRPTSERVREALFSRLEHIDMVRDMRVLDLYAGSGALGLEALSRGARQAVLVEKSRPAVAVVRENAKTFGSRVSVQQADVTAFVTGRTPQETDLILIDPPYDLSEEELAKVLDGLVPWLEKDGLIVVERSVRSPEPTWPQGITREDRRVWGETVAWFASFPASVDEALVDDETEEGALPSAPTPAGEVDDPAGQTPRHSHRKEHA